MTPPLLPATLDVEFEPDGFTCVLRSNEALMSAPTLRWVGAGSVLACVLGMIAVGPVSPLLGGVGLFVWPALVVAALFGGAKALHLLLAAPRQSRVRCTHDAVSVEILVHGMLRGDLRLHLSEVEACRIGGQGLQIVVRRDDRTDTVEIPAHNPVAELEWIAATIAAAAARRAEFDADERSEARAAARAAAARLAGDGLNR